MSLLSYNVIWVWLILHFHAVYTQDFCTTRMSCQDCIRDSSVCVWCAMDNFNGTRCQAENSSNSDWCPKQLENPSNSAEPSAETKNFSGDDEKIVQIKPQEYNMKLRPGKSKNFTFSFQSASDFPVDLYFLVDASRSMDSIRAVTAEKSKSIYENIKSMTNKVELGFGTFVDKAILPFASSSDLKHKATYSFHHHLKLTDNFTKFQEVVRDTPSGMNRDEPEGGLDALAQVMTCKNLIKWRNESTKIIVFLTNGPYHAAGDGKSAGIFQPYDGECYSQDGNYNKELEMDYPSLGIINKLAVENNMIILFFVEKKVENVYSALKNVISGSKCETFSNKTASNDDSIPRTLKEIYEKISKKVILKVQTKHQKNIQISFAPNCIADNSGSECDVEVGKEKPFEGTIKLKKYDGNSNIKVDIAVASVGEKLTLNIDVIKNCGCESEDRVEKISAYCNGEQRVCGECVCGTRRYGDRCACERSDAKGTSDNSACSTPGSTDVCSGQGICECGRCFCYKGYSGKHCECNELSCPFGSGQVCSGETHGKCNCGNCKCEDGWTGKACECSTFNCVVNGKACNGRGHCNCGDCECEEIAEWDQRTIQDKNCRVTPCSTCHNRQCSILYDCAKCLRESKNGYCTSCHDKIQTRVVQTMPEEYLKSSTWNVCPDIKAAVGCYSKMVYRYDDSNYTLELVVEKEENCNDTYYLFGGVFLVALILIGVGTLIAWKVLTEARDRQEYHQFLEKSKHGGGVVSNPLYENPTVSFDNPRFRKGSILH